VSRTIKQNLPFPTLETIAEVMARDAARRAPIGDAHPFVTVRVDGLWVRTVLVAGVKP
jgi:hypothetical protein